MQTNYKDFLVYKNTPLKRILEVLNEQAPYAIAFLVDDDNRLIGSVTDGDVRRGFIKGLDFDNAITDFIQPDPFKLTEFEFTPRNFKVLREKLIKIVPVVDADSKITGIIYIDRYKSLLPLDAVIMAGGEGLRLRPLTLNTPKPLLMIGDKPIIEHVVDRLVSYGIFSLCISVRYLGEQLQNYLGDGSSKQVNISYLWEKEPMGTIGCVTLKDTFKHDHILLMNSDLLTNVDFEDMYSEFIKSNADMIVATIPYKVTIPYGVIEFADDTIRSIKEKPTYTYYSNAGIYIIKKECLAFVPHGKKFDATDLIGLLVEKKRKVINYPILLYWLDIGKHEDYQKAQEDIKHIKF